jgi:hypothetical protein
MLSFISSRPAALAFCMLSLLGTSHAHTVMTTLFVDGVNQGDGVCIRMNNNGSTSNFFVSPISSKDVACGRKGKALSSLFCASVIELTAKRDGRRSRRLPCVFSQILFDSNIRIP